MADNQIVFSYVKTGAENKELQQDGKGYYLVNIGAFNSYNQSGAFYLMDGVKDLVENKSSSLYRRLNGSFLKGEAGHPNYEPGMSTLEFYERNMRLEQTRVSHHFRDIIFKETKTPSGRGGNVVLVQAWVKPDGPMGDALKKDLDDPEINVAFSIRCFTKDRTVGGTTIKQVIQIITWDWVVEPGIKLANKFDTVLGTESLVDSKEFSPVSMEELNSLKGRHSISTEDNTNEIITEMDINSKRYMSKFSNNILNKW